MAQIRQVSPRQALAQIGGRIRDLRISRHITQGELAKAAGVSLRTLNRLEIEGDVRLETVVRVATALRVNQQLDRLFVLEETRSLDELLESQRPRPRRVRKGNRT